MSAQQQRSDVPAQNVAPCTVAHELEMRIAMLENALLDIRNSTREIAQAMVKIARLEEQHNGARHSLDRAFNAIRNLEARDDEIMIAMARIQETLKPLHEARAWVVGGMITVIGVVGAAALAVVLKL